MASVAFIIPLRSPASANNWTVVSALCNRTLASLKSQSSEDWRCILVCNQRPRDFKADPRIKVVEESFPEPETRQDCMRDKRRKKDAALLEICSSTIKYVMALDADDLLERDFVRTVAKWKSPYGLVLDKGYEYSGGYFAVRRKGFDARCGSCCVLSMKAISSDERIWKQPHQEIARYCRSVEKPLVPIRSYPVVHVLQTGENWSGNHSAIDVKSVRSLVRSLPYVRPVTQRFRRKFNLHPLQL